MGTILQHGIFLPAEGERNCYTGLASNWTILDGVIGGYSSHAANLTIHVTAADKEAWNGKADASALTAHTGNTTIHVTAEDKTKWDAVTTKANDTDVVHKSRAETIAGEKTFTDNTFFNSVRATSSAETGGQGSTILPLFSILTFANGDPSVIARLNFRALGSDGSKSLYPHENNQCSLGVTSRRYSNVFSYTINSNNPGALSLPDLTAGVDISGYITNLSKGVNTYTPPANGWLSIRVKKTSLTHASLMIYQTGGLLSSCETTEFGISGTNLPVLANKNVEIYIIADSLASAKFYPCQGNI